MGLYKNEKVMGFEAQFQPLL